MQMKPTSRLSELGGRCQSQPNSAGVSRTNMYFWSRPLMHALGCMHVEPASIGKEKTRKILSCGVSRVTRHEAEDQLAVKHHTGTPGQCVS